MHALKRTMVLTCSALLIVFGALFLTGCGEDVAATFDGGEITEEQVTTAIENVRANNYEDDDEGWQTYIEERSWDEDGEYEDAEGEGTVAELREYVTKELVKQELIKQDIEEQGIEVTDEELQEYVDQQESLYEYYYAGGMEGTAESILQMMGYSSEEEFAEDCREELLEQKLQEQVTGSDDEEASEEEASEEEDSDAAWDEYVEKLYKDANVSITDCPSDLSYDPKVITKSSDESAEDESAEDENATEDEE